MTGSAQMTPGRGKLFVIAAPSGAGKTSLVRALMKRLPALRFSISYTTRKQRETERTVTITSSSSNDEFERMVDAGEFLEHAQVFDNYYGTSRDAGGADARRRRQRAARDRLAGRAADSPRHARVPHDFRPAAVARSARAAPARTQAPTATRSSRAGCAIRSPTCRTGTSSTTWSSTTTSSVPLPSCRRSSRGRDATLATRPIRTTNAARAPAGLTATAKLCELRQHA